MATASNEEKKLKALMKKLKQIEELKQKPPSGDPEVQKKLAKEAEIRDEIHQLQAGSKLSEEAAEETPTVSQAAAMAQDNLQGHGLAEQIDEVLSEQTQQLVEVLDPVSHKQFRQCSKKLREISKLLTQGLLEKLQQEKVERAPEYLVEIRPLLAQARERASSMKAEEIEMLRRDRIAEAQTTAEINAQREREVAARRAASGQSEEPRNQLRTTRPRFGIDVGGVLNKHFNDSESVVRWETSVESAAPYAMKAVERLVHSFGADNVFIVSKCGEAMQQKTRTWLFRTMNICSTTGFLKDNANFCRDGTGPHGKGPIAGNLELSHFVDDKDENLWSVYEDPAGNSQPAIKRHNGMLFHFSRGGADDRPPRPVCWQSQDRPPNVVPVANWLDLLRHLGLDRGVDQSG